jgi:hypothetical protein
MSLLLLKLTLTPLLMWLVTVSARRRGPGLAGVLAGLPLTSGPISIFLFLEEGSDFAVRAAVSSLVAVAAVAWFSVGYGRLAYHQPIARCLLAGVACFGVVLFAFSHIRSGLPGAITSAVVSILVALATLPNRETDHQKIQYPPWDLPVRILTATSLVIFVTASASLLGPQSSGLFSPIPVVAWPLCIFVHLHQGAAAAIRVLRGIAQGAFGVCIFYVMVAIGLPRFSPALVYLSALVAALLVTLPWLRRETPRFSH